jgi:predicted nucleotidyltransferase
VPAARPSNERDADLAERVIRNVERHPSIGRIRLAGSRARGTPGPHSDWDFLVETTDFPTVAAALPRLLSPLEPLAQQWDRLSDQQCWMLILRGPLKVDLIFADEPHAHELPWEPSAKSLHALDAHFWDWTLWLRAKVEAGKREFVAAELRKLYEHLLAPLGAERVPASIGDAVALYRAARAAAEQRFGCEVSRHLEAEVSPVLEQDARR